MAYSVRILFLNQGEEPPSKQMEGDFTTLQEAWDAGKAEVLAYQLRSIETAFQVLDSTEQIVEFDTRKIDR